MGVSTDAFLFYGMTLDEEGEPEWLENHIANADGTDDVYDLGELLIKKFGVSLDSHCHYDAPYYFLTIGEPVHDDKPTAPGYTVAWRGSPRKIRKLEVGSDWDRRLREAADYIGWPQDERNVGWWLASNWS